LLGTNGISDKNGVGQNSGGILSAQWAKNGAVSIVSRTASPQLPAEALPPASGESYLMQIVQLELDLWQSLEVAAQFPETADVVALCVQLERAMTDYPLSEQLQVGGEAISQLAEVFVARADWMISGWQHRHSPIEPVIKMEDCSELFVQSLYLDVSEFFEEPEPVHYPEHRRSPAKEEATIVAEMDKDTLLGLVDEWEPEGELSEAELMRQVTALAHGEEVSVWVAMIQDFFSQQSHVGCRQGQYGIALPELGRAIGLELVPLWIGLLHGRDDWQLQQTGEFYEPESIQIQLAN
jgi:hypothetical protein